MPNKSGKLYGTKTFLNCERLTKILDYKDKFTMSTE